MTQDIRNKIQIYKFKDTELHNVYYDLDKDEFYVKKSKNTTYFTPIKWRNILCKYKNKKDDENKQKHINIFISIIQKQNKAKKLLNQNGKMIKKKS
jgi:hypothetical protein